MVLSDVTLVERLLSRVNLRQFDHTTMLECFSLTTRCVYKTFLGRNLCVRVHTTIQVTVLESTMAQLLRI